MVDKVYGNAVSAESLVGGLDFFTVQTYKVDIVGNGNVTQTQQALFNRMIEIISQKAQPILLTAPTAGTATAGMPGFLGTNVTVNGQPLYTFKFAVEHNGLWVEAGATDAKAQYLQKLFNGVGTLIANGVDDNVVVTFAASL